MPKKDSTLDVGNLPLGPTDFLGIVQDGASVQVALQAAILAVFAPAYAFTATHDCLAAANDATWATATSNTGTVVSITATGNRIGVLRLGLGTNAGATAFLGLADLAAFRLGQGAALWRARLELASVSDGTNTFTARAGFLDAAAGEATDGVFVRYTHGTNSGKWQFVTRANGTETATDTGITAAAATDLVIEIAVNAAGSEATCTIDGTLVATNTTNIPTAAGRNTSAGICAVRSAGTAAKDAIDVDYQHVRIDLTTAR